MGAYEIVFISTGLKMASQVPGFRSPRRTLAGALLALLLLSIPSARAAPFAYITNNGSNNVSVLDTASNTVTATVAVGSFPTGVAVNPAGTRVYVANIGSNAVSGLDTASKTGLATAAGGKNPPSAGGKPAAARGVSRRSKRTT